MEIQFQGRKVTLDRFILDLSILSLKEPSLLLEIACLRLERADLSGASEALRAGGYIPEAEALEAIL